jgi:Mg-chelatase subunit ChlD
LARSIDQLDPKVNFNVVFYSNDIRVWQEPPGLLPSTRANKAEATKWFMALEAKGPTLLFPALMKALEYSDVIKKGSKKPRTGADTIFLLSDGSPTTPDGKVLHPEDLEEQYRRFLEANELYHCVVHTIGVGPKHNRTLMKRIARDTGGKYKAVGAD